MFPDYRLRRLRRTPAMRDLVRETHFSVTDLILPVFVVDGTQVREPISSLPGQFRQSIDLTADMLREAWDLGIRAAILFGVVDASKKDPTGSVAWDANGLPARALRTLKPAVPEMTLIADLCFCEYTDHGHCGVLKPQKDGVHSVDVDNDATLENLRKQAVTLAEAGADWIAPSGMMDGTVAAVRDALDDDGFSDTAIMMYSAKFASAFYGPFRDAADCAPNSGDRKGYQMDPGNRLEAMREIELDIAEGADIVMVKPGLPYLDIVRDVKDRFGVPTAVYNVSGEYAMVKAAAANGWVDETRIVSEIMTAFKRAGADMILTYWAMDIARRT